MPSPITRRILGASGVPQLFSVLESLGASDLQSLLLEVYQARAGRLDPARLQQSRERAPLFAPSDADARLLNLFDRAAFSLAREFEALDLSPVCPLGAAHVLGGLSQNHVLTSIRNAEALGDASTALALECARRRRAAAASGSGKPVRLCSSHRVIRLQPFDVPAYRPHFRMFALATAGRDTGSLAFEIAHLVEHLEFYLLLFRALAAEGFAFDDPLVEVSSMPETEAALRRAGVTREEVRQAIRAHHVGGSERFLAGRNIALPEDVDSPAGDLARVKSQVLDPMRARFPEARFRVSLARLEGLGYYSSFALRISAATPDGVRYPIIDGGFTDWTARLLGNRKERLLMSGVGSELACSRYRIRAPGVVR